MTTTNEHNALTQSHFSQIELDQAQGLPLTEEVENYFKPIATNKKPEDKPLNKNLAAYFNSSLDRFLGDFEAQDYTLHRSFIESTYQVRLFYSRYVPKKEKKATLCIVHGFGEHSGRWIDVADFFVKQGFIVHMVDLRGFGHSGGPRFYANIDALHQDIEVLLNQGDKDLPLFLMGHSMGGALVTTLMIKNPGLNIAGVILSSPMYDLSPERPLDTKKKVFIKAVGDDLEDIILNAMISCTSLTKNNIEVKKAIDDRLMTPLLSFKLGKTLVLLLENTVPLAKRFTYPCYVFHGRKDTLTNCRATQEFVKNIGSTDCTFHIVETGYHEILNDIERDEMLKRMTEWMNRKLKEGVKNYGVHVPLKHGLDIKKRNQFKTRVTIAILAIIYLLLLRKFRSNPLLKTNIRWLLFPISFLFKSLGLLQ